jgi:DMSO/TMAO reductase YedYZ molybdopterin-dependent catalytic subunit
VGIARVIGHNSALLSVKEVNTRTMSISTEELQLAQRNAGMPLEALRWDITPPGLHYLLIHYDIPAVDPQRWRLEIGGRVGRRLVLSLAELQQRERVAVPTTMECAGNGRARMEPRPVSQPWLSEAVGTAVWTGTPLAGLLREAEIDEGAVDVVFTGLDRGVEGGVPQAYERSLPLGEALGADAVLAWGIGDAPLPPQHGFPLRLVVPGWYGMTNVKWLHRITVLDTPFTGYQQARGYRMRTSEDDPGTPVTRMMPRALMRPPGVPDFMTRRRFVAPGTCIVEGRAWSGWGPIERVEVSADGGASWEDAELGDAPGPHAWRGWSYRWHPQAGEHELACRATDAAGNAQPLEAPWNVGGYANNAVQRVAVTVA